MAEKDIVVRIEELMDLFGGEVTTADKIQRPQSALDREMFEDANIRFNKADGGRINFAAAGVVPALPVLSYPASFGLAKVFGLTTAGVGAKELGNKVTDYIQKNPQVLETPQAKAILLSVGITPDGLVFGPDDKDRKEAEPIILSTPDKPVGLTDYRESFGDDESTKELLKPAPETFPAETEKLPITSGETKPIDQGPIILENTANDIKNIIDSYRSEKIKPGKTQPTMNTQEKSDLLNLVVDKFQKDQNRFPSFTEVQSFLPQFSNLKEVIDYSQLNLPRQKADYDRSDPNYIKTMENKAQIKAISGNTISIFGQKNFFPKNVTLPNGNTVNAKTFFEENFAKRVELGPGREETKKITLNNNELAKLFNTNVRKIEKATKIIKDNPNFKAEYPPVRPANYGNLISIERLKEARKYLTESELENIKSQEKQLNNLNTMFKTGDLVVTDFPNLVKALNTTLDKETGKLDFSIKKTAKQMIERSKNNSGLFDISHTIPKTSKQKNIEFLRNRNILDYKTNQGLFKSFEAYVRNKKKDPEYNLRLQEFDAYMKEMGQRVKIGNKFFGLDEKMFDSVTGEHTGINRSLKYFGLPKFENGVPLRTTKAYGGPMNMDLKMLKPFATGGLSGGDKSGPPPERGPLPQGLQGLMKRGIKI